MGQDFVRTYSEKFENSDINKLNREVDNILHGDNSNIVSNQDEGWNSPRNQLDFRIQSQENQTQEDLSIGSQASSQFKKFRKSITDREIRDDALDFMRGVMDECTHLGNFATPVDTSLIIIVAANHDAYVPRQNVISLEQLWPGSEVRYVDSGHINAFLFHNVQFR